MTFGILHMTSQLPYPCVSLLKQVSSFYQSILETDIGMNVQSLLFILFCLQAKMITSRFFEVNGADDPGLWAFCYILCAVQ